MMAVEEYNAELAAKHWWWRARAYKLNSILAKYLRPEAKLTLMDVGCGTGTYLPVLGKYGAVIGFDISSKALDMCICGNEYVVMEGDAYAIPYGDEGVQVAVNMDLLEHLDDDVAALKEMRRVLTKNGLVICAVPSMPSLWSEHDERLEHRRRYTVESLSKAMLEANFEILDMSYAMGLIFPGAWIHRKLSRKPSNGTPEGFGLPSWANRTLERLCNLETNSGLRFPFGTSLFAVGRKA